MKRGTDGARKLFAPKIRDTSKSPRSQFPGKNYRNFSPFIGRLKESGNRRMLRYSESKRVEKGRNVKETKHV